MNTEKLLRNSLLMDRVSVHQYDSLSASLTPPGHLEDKNQLCKM